MIRNERAARAAFHPSGSEHERIDNQLASPAEKIGEGLFAFWPIEHMGLLYLFPGKLSALPAQFIPQAREFLLLLQQLLSGGDPLGRRYDLWMLHRSRCHD